MYSNHVEIMLKYALGFGAIFWVFMLMNIRRKMIKINQNVEDDEIRIFIRWFYICVPGQLFLLQVFQLLGSSQTPFHPSFLDLDNIFDFFRFIVAILFQMLILYLVVVKNGAETIAKYCKDVLKPFPIQLTKNMVKGFFILMFFMTVISTLSDVFDVAAFSLNI